MGMERIEQIKKQKPFSPWDILCYVLLLVLVCSLFLALFLPRKQPIEGIQIFFRDELICSYTFDEGESVENGWEECVRIYAENDALYLFILTDDGFNKLLVDGKNRSIKMVDADCGFHKDCTYMSPISTQGEVIICLPHGLQIMPIGSRGSFDSPTLG